MFSFRKKKGADPPETLIPDRPRWVRGCGYLAGAVRPGSKNDEEPARMIRLM